MQALESNLPVPSVIEHGAQRELSRALYLALESVAPDGRVSPQAASAVREALRAADAGMLRLLATDPAVLLPPFTELPEHARAAVRHAILAADRTRMYGYALGPVHDAAIRGAWQLRLAFRALKKHRQAMARALGLTAETLAFATRSAPAWALDHAVRTWHKRSAAHASRPALLPLLRLAGIDPRALVASWASGVPQLEPYRGYWHDPRRQCTVGLVIGFDLLPGSEGFWFVESNVSVAQRGERAALYERDPFVANLLEHARELQLDRIVVLDNNADGVEPRTRVQYETIARELGLSLTLVSRRSLPRGAAPEPRSFGIPPIGDRTLVVRIKTYATSLDHLLNNKRLSIRALERYQAEQGDPQLRVPRSGPWPTVTELDAASPFPNVVYKLPELDAARGLVFLKARDAAHAVALIEGWRRTVGAGRAHRSLEALKRADSIGIYQSFVCPRLLPGRHGYIVRAHVLITPTGHRFLSAHRVVAAHGIPDRLEPGIVRDPTPYLINFSSGAHYEVVPPDEERQVQAAALAAARGLAWAVEQAFETEPPISRAT